MRVSDRGRSRALEFPAGAGLAAGAVGTAGPAGPAGSARMARRRSAGPAGPVIAPQPDGATGTTRGINAAVHGVAPTFPACPGLADQLDVAAGTAHAAGTRVGAGPAEVAHPAGSAIADYRGTTGSAHPGITAGHVARLSCLRPAATGVAAGAAVAEQPGGSTGTTVTAVTGGADVIVVSAEPACAAGAAVTDQQPAMAAGTCVTAGPAGSTIASQSGGATDTTVAAGVAGPGAGGAKAASGAPRPAVAE